MKSFLSSSTIGVQLFILLTFIGSLSGLYLYNVTTEMVLLMLLGYFIYGCFGIVVTFHRYLTHKSYKTHPIIVKIFSILGCLGGTGSSLAWVAIHINHHLKSDKINDPHSPYYKGLKIFALNYEHEVDDSTKWRMRSIITDPFHQFLHRYYFAILGTWSLVLYAIGGFYLMIFLHWAPVLLTAIMSNVVNYVGHKPNWIGGYRRYNLNDQSSNNWLWAIPTWGESWHNNHHRHPKNFRCGEKWWEIDVSGFIIKLIKHG
jgi:stearoyl-CoA desaturase (delta-9 desaturase)